MSTSFFGQLSPGVLACVAAVLFICHSAPAAFMDLGTSGWQYDVVAPVPSGVTIPAPSTSGSTTSFTLQKNFWGSETVEIVFRTKPATGTDPAVTQVEHFFMMNFDITTSLDWIGFQVKLIDKFDAVGPPPQGASSTEQSHPIWAHIHPSHNVPSGVGPFYDPFLTRTPNTSVGVEQMTLSNGFIPAGSVWLGSRFRLHDLSTQGYANDGVGIPGVMEFRLLLTPIPTPEPSSIVLMLSGIGILAGYGWRRRLPTTRTVA